MSAKVPRTPTSATSGDDEFQAMMNHKQQSLMLGAPPGTFFVTVQSSASNRPEDTAKIAVLPGCPLADLLAAVGSAFQLEPGNFDLVHAGAKLDLSRPFTTTAEEANIRPNSHLIVVPRMKSGLFNTQASTSMSVQQMQFSQEDLDEFKAQLSEKLAGLKEPPSSPITLNLNVGGQDLIVQVTPDKTSLNSTSTPPSLFRPSRSSSPTSSPHPEGSSSPKRLRVISEDEDPEALAIEVERRYHEQLAVIKMQKAAEKAQEAEKTRTSNKLDALREQMRRNKLRKQAIINHEDPAQAIKRSSSQPAPLFGFKKGFLTQPPSEKILTQSSASSPSKSPLNPTSTSTSDSSSSNTTATRSTSTPSSKPAAKGNFGGMKKGFLRF